MIPLSSMIAPVVYNVANMFLSSYNEQLIKRQTVKELTVGYYFPIYDLLEKAVIKPLEFFNVPLPSERLPDSRFGLFSARNHTNKGGPYTIWTGKRGGPRKFLRFSAYKGKR